MVMLGGRDVVEKMNQLLANQVLMEERKAFNGAEDNRIGKDGGVKRMGSKGR